MFRAIARFFSPLPVIARELSTIRELYELDLQSRNPPIIRITETPKRGDTEVTYTDETPVKKTTAERFKDIFSDDGDDDD